MSRALDDNNRPRTSTAYPTAVLAYAVLCFVAAVFVIASAVLQF